MMGWTTLGLCGFLVLLPVSAAFAASPADDGEAASETIPTATDFPPLIAIPSVSPKPVTPPHPVASPEPAPSTLGLPEEPAEAKAPSPAPERLPQPAATPSANDSWVADELYDAPKRKDESRIPSWGLMLGFAPHTFTKAPQVASSSVSIYATSVGVDYELPLPPRLGILGVGATASLFFVTPPDVLTNQGQLFASAGLLVRYQARYFDDQPFVPYLGYGDEFIHYHFVNGGSQNLEELGPLVGLMFLLNTLDPRSADELRRSSGILRSYFFIEARGTTSGDTTIPFSPAAWYFGLRLEL